MAAAGPGEGLVGAGAGGRSERVTVSGGGDGHGLWGEGALDWREAKEVNLWGSVAGASERARSLGLGVLGFPTVGQSRRSRLWVEGEGWHLRGMCLVGTDGLCGCPEVRALVQPSRRAARWGRGKHRTLVHH